MGPHPRRNKQGVPSLESSPDRLITLEGHKSLYGPAAVAGLVLEHSLQLLDELLHVLYGVLNVLGRHPALVEVLVERFAVRQSLLSSLSSRLSRSRTARGRRGFSAPSQP